MPRASATAGMTSAGSSTGVEVDERDAVGEPLAQALGDLQRQAGLAGAAGAGQREQARGRAEQPFRDLVGVPLASDQRRRTLGQAADVGLDRRHQTGDSRAMAVGRQAARAARGGAATSPG